MLISGKKHLYKHFIHSLFYNNRHVYTSNRADTQHLRTAHNTKGGKHKHNCRLSAETFLHFGRSGEAFRPKRHHAPAERERFARSLRWGDSVFAFNKTENIFVMMMVLSTFAKDRASRATGSCFLHACACAPASYP